MIVNRDVGFVFARIPRTASTSIAAALRSIPGSVEVMNAKRVAHHCDVPGDARGLYTFAVVRDPYERTLSVYYRRRDGTNEPLFDIAQEESFASYLGQLAELGQPHDCPQTEFIGRLPRIDAALRFDGIPACLGDLPFAEKIPGLPNLGKLLPENWRDDYDEQTAEVVYERNRTDFDAYDFDPESWKA